MTPEPRRATLDVSGLPEVVFGSKSVNWWGTLSFMTIEGATLAICAAAYLYLRRNFLTWPPPPVPLPDLLVPTVNLVLILLVIVPLAFVHRAALRRELVPVRLWLTVGAAMSLAATVLRYFELRSLNVRWDENAYGSVAWLVLGAHATLLIADLLETGVFAALSYSSKWEDKHFSDAEDAAVYQYFLSLVWVPLYFLVYFSPRWL
ncbi:MAG TPA: cytochrome c oxidase subunit 3 [Longimicrobium sp.]|jgi:heme/copper-type cytochrome/quinol oxidase subunit 3